MEFTSPLCNDLSRFNRGKAAQLSTIEIPLESFDPNYYFEFIGRYTPDSMESFNLADKEVTIKNAVDFFETYINNLPYPENSLLDMCVVSVDVMKINDNTYGYSFMTTKKYDGIPFDSIQSGTVYSQFDDYSFVIGQGFMVESNNVDSVYGIYRAQTMSNLIEHTDVISIQTAAQIISEKMSDSVVFEVQKAEIVYSEKAVQGQNVDVEKHKQLTSAAWKFTLFNPNDNLTYVCYVDAATGENFRYYTMSAQ